MRIVYTFPAGKTLTTTGEFISTDHAIRYNATHGNCLACALKARCCPNMPARRIVRDIHEDAPTSRAGRWQRLRQIARRERVEMRFAHLKTHHRFERLGLRGLSGARDEFHLAAIVQNLKAMALRLLRPPSHVPACA